MYQNDSTGLPARGAFAALCLLAAAGSSTVHAQGDYLYVDRLMPLLAPRGGGISIADMLMTYVQEGELSLLAECSPSELERFRTRHPSWEQLFHIVELKPVPPSTMPSLLVEFQQRTGAPVLAFRDDVDAPGRFDLGDELTGCGDGRW